MQFFSMLCFFGNFFWKAIPFRGHILFRGCFYFARQVGANEAEVAKLACYLIVLDLCDFPQLSAMVQIDRNGHSPQGSLPEQPPLGEYVTCKRSITQNVQRRYELFVLMLLLPRGIVRNPSTSRQSLKLARFGCSKPNAQPPEQNPEMRLGRSSQNPDFPFTCTRLNKEEKNPDNYRHV